MEDSYPRGLNGSVHTVDLSESKELCIDVTKNKAIGDPVACEAIIEDRPGKIIRKLSGVGSFDEDAKVLLSKIAEALGLDVLDKVSEKLTNGTRVKETSLDVESDPFDVTLDYIEESIDNMCNRGASKKPNLVTSQLAETLKGFAELSNKSVHADQMTRIAEKLKKKYREYKRLCDQYQFMSPKTDEDSLHVVSDSDSATTSSNANFRRSSRSNEKASRSRPYMSQASTSTGSESLAIKRGDCRSGSSKGPKHHKGKRFGSQWLPQKRDMSPRSGRKCVSTTVTEETTTASSTETGTATESSVGSGETIVPIRHYGLRPRKSADREEREYEDFLYFLRRTNEAEVPVGVLKKVLEAFAKEEESSTEEVLFCEYLKVRLAALEPKEKRRVIYKIHQALELPEDGNGN